MGGGSTSPSHVLHDVVGFTLMLVLQHMITSHNLSIHLSNESLQLLLFHVCETWIPSWILDVTDLFMHFGNVSFNHVLPILQKVFNTKGLGRSLILLRLILLKDGVYQYRFFWPSYWCNISIAIIVHNQAGFNSTQGGKFRGFLDKYFPSGLES